MHPISAFIYHPVKVAVGVLLVAMFGVIALFRMPMQLSPDVERPTVSISTRWPGASPQEVEKEIVNQQEEQLKSVEGVTKMTSESQDSSGSITLEFQVGTNLEEAVLKVNSALQQVREYPIDADKPVIRTSSITDNAIAWFILSARPPSRAQLAEFQQRHPDLREALDSVANSENIGLSVLRLRHLAQTHPEVQQLLPAAVDVPKRRKFAEDVIEAAFERVPGVANSNVLGGQRYELQVIVDPNKLASRGLTIADVRDALRTQNRDTSAGDLWEGKRRYVVRTLGQFQSPQQVADQILKIPDGQPVYLRDVAEVRLGYTKPEGFVRRFGVANLAINVQRESGANVVDVMKNLRRAAQRLNDGVLQRENLAITQVYDETQYINSAVGLVNQNIILGSALTVIVLMLFLHISARALTVVPLLALSAALAVAVTPWFFLLTLAIILVAGFWFARGTLVVALAIPTSIIGTFLILYLLGRSLNVISLAGLAFAVGMLVDNAVVVLENIFRHYQMGERPFEAARRAAVEVWGAVLASTLTTLAVFLPVIFLQGEAGQLFLDIALAISAAVGLSLLVSVIVIPTASARILDREYAAAHSDHRLGGIQRGIIGAGRGVTSLIVQINQRIQRGWLRRVSVVLILVIGAIGLSYLLMPKVEYLPSGNRNLVICLITPPPGYNLGQLAAMGQAVEDELQPYWDVAGDARKLDYPAIGDFFYVARGRSVFLGLSAQDPLRARGLIELIQQKLSNKFPGSYVVSFQTSLFGRGLSGNRTIDVEIRGPQLGTLIDLGRQVMSRCVGAPDDPRVVMPPGTQARPVPSLDLSNPELHVSAKLPQASELGVSNTELGYTVNALIDGAYVGDYFLGGEKIDLVILGSDQYEGNTQDLRDKYIATPNERTPVRLDAIADVQLGAGPEQINHRERERAISIQVTPPDELSLEAAIEIIHSQIVAQLDYDSQYQITLSGTADKLQETWVALRWNFVLAILITYLLMAALFESWIYPLVIILSVPMGAVGGVLGLKLLGLYLGLRGEVPQSLDVLTMLGFVILIGTVVNNAILLVHQSLIFMRTEQMNAQPAVLESIRARIRPIFMTTTTTVFGLSPLVFFPGAGSELYRGLGAVVLGGLIVSTLFTLVLVPTMFTLMVDARESLKKLWSKLGPAASSAFAPQPASAGPRPLVVPDAPGNGASGKADHDGVAAPGHASRVH